MKSSPLLDFTYKGHLQKVYFNCEQTDEEEVKGILGKFKELSNFSLPSLPTYFAIDYSKSSYKLMTENFKSVIGFDSREFIEGGLGFVISLFHKDDFRVFNEKIFSANLNFLKKTPQAEHHNYIFSYTFRVKTSSGAYKWILQRSSYITSKETNIPTFSMGMVMDVTNFITDVVMLHSIDRIDRENGLFNTVATEHNYFYPDEEFCLLTSQEKNILKWLADGWSTKQLADKLFLSEHTISTHRKNMIQKTNTKNITELVAFAIRSRLI